LQVDLAAKVKRSDAIQSFQCQETPMVRITDSDGVTGTGYSYTIGTGGSSVIKLLDDHLVPLLLQRKANDIERIWRDLFFHVHSTTVGALTSIALAAIDSAL
jgi:L-alanine-DL-glutamate epimerase-like enolase superfamily enzyme